MTHYRRISLGLLTLLLGVAPFRVSAATLSLAPADATVTVGSTITETVMVSSTDQAMNAIDGLLSFPSDLLQVVSVSKGASVLTLWVQDPSYSNSSGSVTFSGVVPNPGYTGGRTQVLSIQFRAKKAGTGTITFAQSAQVLANDGNGTDILTTSLPATIHVSAAQTVEEPSTPTPALQTGGSGSANLIAHITSSTHPVETNWYALSHAVFDWTNDASVTSIKLGYDKNADGKPTVVYTEPISHKELDLTDGIWYFHVQEKGAGGWGSVSSFRVQVDTAPPRPFVVSFATGSTTPEGVLVSALFTTTDDLSGIDHYMLSVDGKERVVSAEEGGGPYMISGLQAGRYVLAVTAYDKAGNLAQSVGEFSVSAKPSSFSALLSGGWLILNYLTIFLLLLAILIALLFIAWYLKTHFMAYRQQLRHRLGLTNVRVHKEFDRLREALGEELVKLDRAQSARALTRSEQRIMTRFKKLLEDSEVAIEKDIEDTAN